MTTDWQVRARRALPWIVGPLALMLRARAVELSPPNPCPGLLELVSIAMLRLQPDMRVGHVYQALEALAIVVGIGAFIELISRTTRRPWVAAAVGLATALGPAFPRTIAPPWEAAAFAACAIAAVLLSARVSSVRTTTRGLCASLLFVALLVPSWAVVAAAVVALCVTTAGRPDQPATRVALAIMASGAVLALTAGLLMLTPPQVFTQPFSWRAVTACIVSPQEVPWHRAFWTGPASAPGRIAWQLGPFGLGLAALGAFVLATRGVQARRLASTLLGLAALCIALLVASLSPATSQASALMPIVIASWWLAPVGLQEMLGSIGPQPMASLATVVILIVLPALQGARVRAEERDDGMRSRGHEAATLRQIVAVT